MKSRTWSLIACAGAPLILTGAARAGFTGIMVVGKPNNYGLFVCNVFATFDRPGEDRFLSAAGTPNSPMDIHVVGGGIFYQNQFGTDTPARAPFFPLVPSLAFDTFVSIGAKSTVQPFPPLVLSPGWDAADGIPGFTGFGASSLGGTNLSWSNAATDPNTDPFNPHFYLGNGQVLIGQFSTLDGLGIVGMFRVSVISNNVATQLDVSFSHFVPAPGALALMAGAWLMRARSRGPAGAPRRRVA